MEEKMEREKGKRETTTNKKLTKTANIEKKRNNYKC